MGKTLSSLVAAGTIFLTACGGGGGSGSGGGGSSSGGSSSGGPPLPPSTTRAYADPVQESLSVVDVERVISLAVAEARARNIAASIAVTDRVGNVLGVFVMNGANLTLKIPDAPSGTAANTELQGLSLPAPAALAGAIAKAITGAYLSSGGNAFSTRTASQIVQQNFPPAPTTVGLESGPLYGVQFSQLPCSDLNQRFGALGGAALIGPKRSPLGLAADPGGFPLYKNGAVVGGVGVMADGIYGFDPNILDIDNDAEEFIALAATIGFDAPGAVRADQINVDGTSLRYSDATAAGLRGGTPIGLASLIGSIGNLIAVPGYNNASVIAGAAYGSESSGVRPSTASEFSNRDAYVLTSGAGTNRFPVRAGTDGAAIASPLSAAESAAVLEEAFLVMTRSRAQIRRPLDSQAQVSISLVDTYGSVLGVVRSPDAPVFGIDVSLQKARTAAFFSNARAATELAANTNPDINAFLVRARTFFGSTAVFTGQTAWSNRAIGNISRPYFPDGEVGRAAGPLSREITGFNPFSTGMQSALVFRNIQTHVSFLLSGGISTDTSAICTSMPDVVAGQNRLQNGIQIFPGSVPIYRGATLVGAIGVSGDGIDQDDMISFLAANNVGRRVSGLGNAPAANRSDQIQVNVGNAQVRLRYISCPFAPFLDTAQQNVCMGL